MKNIQRHRYKDKKIFETRTLSFDPYSYSEIDLVIGLIQDNLTPDLLKGRKSLMYPSDVLTNKYYGHCYHLRINILLRIMPSVPLCACLYPCLLQFNGLYPCLVVCTLVDSLCPCLVVCIF